MARAGGKGSAVQEGSGDERGRGDRELAAWWMAGGEVEQERSATRE